MDINNNSICEFKNYNADCEFLETWEDIQHKTARLCKLRNKLIVTSICKICEKRKQYYKENEVKEVNQ